MKWRFGNWVNWKDRNSLPDIDRPGTYVLVRFDGHAPLTVDPVTADVIYIGLTERSFRERFAEFVRSASRRVGGHSGGWTFSALYCGSKPSELPGWLHVAVCAFELEDIDRIAGHKEQLLSDYVTRHGRPPTCNTKIPG